MLKLLPMRGVESKLLCSLVADPDTKKQKTESQFVRRIVHWMDQNNLHFYIAELLQKYLLAQLPFHVSGIKQVSEQHLIFSQSLERKQNTVRN